MYPVTYLHKSQKKGREKGSEGDKIEKSQIYEKS